MRLIERFREHRKTPPIIRMDAAQESVLARNVLMGAREFAQDTMAFFTKGPIPVKIDKQTSLFLEHLITQKHAVIPDDESPEASEQIQGILDQEYNHLIQAEIDRANPRNREEVINSIRYLYQAADIMSETYKLDTSFPEEEEARKDVQRLVKKYRRKVGPFHYYPTMRLRVASVTAAVLVGLAGGQIANGSVPRALEQAQNFHKGLQSTTEIPVFPPVPIPLSQLSDELLSNNARKQIPTATEIPKIDK